MYVPGTGSVCPALIGAFWTYGGRATSRGIADGNGRQVSPFDVGPGARPRGAERGEEHRSESAATCTPPPGERRLQSQAGRRRPDVLRAPSARRLSEVARTSRGPGTSL
jgi:hypothetical protein